MQNVIRETIASEVRSPNDSYLIGIRSFFGSAGTEVASTDGLVDRGPAKNPDCVGLGVELITLSRFFLGRMHLSIVGTLVFAGIRQAFDSKLVNDEALRRRSPRCDLSERFFDCDELRCRRAAKLMDFGAGPIRRRGGAPAPVRRPSLARRPSPGSDPSKGGSRRHSAHPRLWLCPKPGFAPAAAGRGNDKGRRPTKPRRSGA